MTIENVQKLCADILASQGINLDIPVKVNGRLTKTLGRVLYIKTGIVVKPYAMEFSKKYIENGEENNIIDTIKHECAHVIATVTTGEKHGHDELFKEICEKLGTANNKAHAKAEYTVERSTLYKYTVKCESCGKANYYVRAGKVVKNISMYACKCGGRLTVTTNY